MLIPNTKKNFFLVLDDVAYSILSNLFSRDTSWDLPRHSLPMVIEIVTVLAVRNVLKLHGEGQGPVTKSGISTRQTITPVGNT